MLFVIGKKAKRSYRKVILRSKTFRLSVIYINQEGK